MRILLTNDDGINSDGLAALKEYLELEHEVWVVAPDGERSGISHFVTQNDPIRVRKVAEQCYTTTGSPADCVIVGLLGLMKQRPDMVLAGINLGPNYGTDLISSGTAAAARQAALMGYPAVALSLDGEIRPFYFAPLSEFIRKNLCLLRDLWDSDHFVNVNAPNVATSPLPIEITRPCHWTYHDKVISYESPFGETFFFLDYSPPTSDYRDDTDWAAVQRGSISVCPVAVHPAFHAADLWYYKAQFH